MQILIPGVLQRPSGKGIEKNMIFRPPGTVKMRLPSKARAQFSLFEGIPKRVPKRSQNGAKMVTKSVPRRSEGAPRALPEKSRKTTPKSELKGSQNGGQRAPKIEQKRCPKTRSITGGSPGRPGVDFGTIWGAILVYFGYRDVLVFSNSELGVFGR